VREFLAREEIEHGFIDVRKAPIDAKDAVTLVRKHKNAIAKRGANLVTLDPKKATDEEIKKHFLGREGTLRAPTVSVGDTIIAGYDSETFHKLLG
jgi:arsenate reductase-like glutaredoxin family protein